MARPKRQRFYEERKVDRISLLPDEVLVSILCLLKLKEATATSILGRRWRYLHTWTCKLDLDGEKSITKLKKMHSSLSRDIYSFEEMCWRAQKYVDEERCCFIKWADSLISTRRSSTLKEFRLLFCLDQTNSQQIDEWLRFALSRGIEKLDLNLTSSGEFLGRHFEKSYNFPYHVVGFDKLKMLKKLSLRYVNVNGDFLKEVVQECRCLEELSVSNCYMLFVEIVDPSPSLRSIDVCMCDDLKSLVIRNSNVVTLKVQPMKDRIGHFVLENVPQLIEFWCWPIRTMMSMIDIRHMLWSVLPQLRLLKFFALDHNIEEEEVRNFCSGVELSNLQQLTVLVLDYYTPLSPLINILDVSPRLERFVIEQNQSKTFSKPPCHRKMAVVRRANEKIPKKYPCLKELKMVGYNGVYNQFEMLMHLVGNGVGLKDIVVDPRGVEFCLNSWWDFPQPQINSRKHARLSLPAQALHKYLPCRININIL